MKSAVIPNEVRDLTSIRIGFAHAEHLRTFARSLAALGMTLMR